MWKLPYVALIAFGSLAGLHLGTAPQGKPTSDQQKEIEKAIKDVQDALKGGDKDKIKDAKNKAILLTDKYFKIPQDNLDGDPTYDPDETSEGSSVPSKANKGKIKVTLGEKAFFWSPDGPNPAALASVKIHEILGHGAQNAGGHWYTDDKGTAIQEIEAYQKELDNAKAIGLSDAEIAAIKERIKAWRDKLNDANKKKVDKGDYILSFLAPGDDSQKALAGTAQLFVTGDVYAGELATTTVRGPSGFDGYVIETELDGSKTETKVGDNGQAIINWAKAAASVTAITTAIVRVFDASHKEVAHGQCNVRPGAAPDIIDPPSVSAIPANLRKGDVITVHGSNIGNNCQMVLGNQIQETLASSANELTTFVHPATLGSQDCYLRSPYGESQSFTTNLYSFVTSAPGRTIVRGEQTAVAAQYESLPPGTVVRFVNLTPGVVRMTVPGATMEGDTAAVTLTNAAGMIRVNLTGLTGGTFRITYAIEIPKR